MGIFPAVAVLTQSLIDFTALGLAKSSEATCASNQVRPASRNDGVTGKPSRVQIEFAMRKSTLGSRPRSSAMSDL